MSIKVTIYNYTFPIHFSYKGWAVKLEKKMAFFKDVGVEATFTPPSINYLLTIIFGIQHYLMR